MNTRNCFGIAGFNVTILKKTLFIILGLIIYSSNLFAQDGYIAKSLNDLGTDLNWSKRVQTSNLIIQGSPYLNDEFKPGEVFYEGKFKISNVPLRYNMYNDEMEFMDKNVVLAIAFPEKIDKVIIGKETFIYIGKSDEKGLKGYVIKWDDTFPCILTKMKVEYFDKEPPQPIVESKPARYERAYDQQYLMKSSNEIESIKSIKKLIQSIGDHENELTNFSKKEKISANDPQELIKLIDYYKGLK